MRNLLILAGIAILGLAAGTVTAGHGGSGHGSAHGSMGHGSLEGHIRHGGGHSELIVIITTQREARAELSARAQLSPGEPETGPAPPGLLMGDLGVGGPEHPIAGHAAGRLIHPPGHAAVGIERGQAVMAQPTAPGGDGSDQDGAATRQPNPTASPAWVRPPGAAGPGRPVSGWSGPGLPGPGRPARPQG
jgi:hypothetical protein